MCFGVAASAQTARDVLDRAVTDFRAGRVAESVEGFDRVARLVPDLAPELWQRGIALYYVGRYQDCRAQFEAHRKVNPDDVENAAWHFLCVAKAETPARARAALLPVGPDSRVPMGQVYRLYAGTLAPEDVMAAAGTARVSIFYARLYLGLYFDAIGNMERALEHMRAATTEDNLAVGGYMYTVAQIHLADLERRAGRR